MGTILDVAERLWTGEDTTLSRHPFTPLAEVEEVAPGVAFVSSFANVVALTTDDGLVLVDTGAWFVATKNHALVRRFSPDLVRRAIFTHGHVDHVMGLGPFEEEGPVEVIAHEAVPARFRRYAKTAGYNGCINARQFGFPVDWPTSYREPDRTYATRLELDAGGTRIVLEHARGETDDATFVWLPEKRVLCTGDLFIWAVPNAGNPQKVQRYAEDWAAALRRMEALGAEVLCPGHGVPIMGHDRVRRALGETAELLESLVTQTLAAMNEGASLAEILAAVRAPPHLLDRPYLRPIYDEPEFIVRNLWRLYGGWCDGDPASLKPAPREVLARERASLAGGARSLARRARELSAAGEHATACHLVEHAWRADRADHEVREARAVVYRAHALHATSLMAKGIYGAAARESEES